MNMETIPETMTGRGIDCPKSPTECGLGNLACTMYGAVWFGGKCRNKLCDKDFVKGDFVGNFAMTEYQGDGTELEIATDPAVERIISDGIVVEDLFEL